MALLHNIQINGVTYGNVGSIKEKNEVQYYYNVTTLDGVSHRKVRYSKTIYTVKFYNLLDGIYTSLRNFVESNKSKIISCGFPNENYNMNKTENENLDKQGNKIPQFIAKDCYVSISSPENWRGYLNGKYFKNGLELELEVVNPDE